ncbi:MAG TPA: ScyD/ScyE family protein [Acidimicrobiales bacterium]|nr:ScyD/ScyE family protein [Acidimicrobiales bacterium]
MRSRSGRIRRWLVAPVLFGALIAVMASPASASPHGDGGLFWSHHWSSWRHGPSNAGQIDVVATGLNQPKKITIAPDGSLLVALSGDGVAPASCTDGSQPSCVDTSGAIDRVTPWGHVSTLIGGLPSVSGGGDMASATGPAEARYGDGGLQVLFQDTDIDPTTGAESFGPAGTLLGDLARFHGNGSGQGSVEAAFGPFEAANNPDNGAGSGVTPADAIDSDPYSFVPYRGGWAVADAAANDLLWVSPRGHISVLAVFPTISETAAPGTLGPTQTTAVPFDAQAVPDAVAVGPDGALYVGELGGFPFNVGSSDVYRVVPGHAPTVYASGFTAIGDIGFDQAGHLLVLEIDQAGLNDPALAGGGLPTPGALIRVGHNGSQTVIASTGLYFPTGLAVGCDGWAYVSNFGVVSATGGPGGVSGEIVKVGLGR